MGRAQIRRFVWLCLVVAVVMLGVGCASPSNEDTGAGDSAEWEGPNKFGLSLLDDGRELDFGNAYWMARLSSMVYGSRDDLVRELAKVGISASDIELIFFENALTSTQAAYIGFRDVGILAFRGTEPTSINDWLTDVFAFRMHTRVGDLHRGFYEALMSVWNDSPFVKANGVANEGIAKHLRRRHGRRSDGNSKPLLMTGHSLGGALGAQASVFAYWDACLREKPDSDPFWAARLENLALHPPCEDRGIYVSSLYTFGSPRPGGRDFSVMSNFTTTPNLYRTSLFRFVHANDLVTSVPDTDYIHACDQRNEREGLIYLTKGGAIDVGGKSTEYLSWGWRNKLLDRIGDHGIDNYARKLLRYAGKDPPPPHLSPERAFHERIKAAYVAPGDPPLVKVDAAQLGSVFTHVLAIPPTNGGTREIFLWTFEGKKLVVFEESYPLEDTFHHWVVSGRSVMVFDASANGLLSAGGETSSPDDHDVEDISLTWFDWLDDSSSR